MPKDRMSKREHEPLYYEEDAFLYQEIPHDPDMEFGPDLEQDVIQSLQHPAEQTKGLVRLLKTRMVFKLPASLFGHKGRGFDIKYRELEQYYSVRTNPDIAVLAVHKDGNRFYEVLKFKNGNKVKTFLDKLDSYMVNTGPASRPTSSLYEDTNAAEYETDLELSKFNMKLFSQFPDVLPREIPDTVRSRYLDESGRLTCYNPGMEIKSDKNDTLWSTKYDLINEMYTFKNDDKHALYAVDDSDMQPSHYALVRAPNSYSIDKLSDIYRQKTGNKPINYNLDQSLDDYYNRSNNSPVVTVRREEEKNVFSAPPPQRNQSSNGFETSYVSGAGRFSRSEKMDIRDEILRGNESDEDDWEKNVTLVREDPELGPQIDDNGSILMYVAHRQVRN